MSNIVRIIRQNNEKNLFIEVFCCVLYNKINNSI